MKITITQGDITTIETEAIVNAANSSLLGGGGVDGAIHRKGGKAILEECVQIKNKQGGCKVGEAVITTAGNLPAKYIIHTVGPVWNNGKGDVALLLQACYVNTLKLAAEKGIKTLSFPNISTGIYGYPKEAAAKVVLETIKELPLSLKKQFEVLNFVCFDADNYNIYTQLFDELQQNAVASLITAEPVGLRGDPYFWQAFKSLATTIEIPKSVEELEKLLLEMFKELTGEYPEKGKKIFVEAFSHGGMSSGHVSSDTWLESGLPLMLEAFKNRN